MDINQAFQIIIKFVNTIGEINFLFSQLTKIFGKIQVFFFIWKAYLNQGAYKISNTWSIIIKLTINKIIKIIGTK